MFVKLAYPRLLLLCIMVFLLCQCTQVVNSTEPVVLVSKKTVSTPYKMPTADYLAKAEQKQGAEQQHLLLLAAGRLISDNKWQQGLAILAQIAPLTPALADEKNLLMARVDVLRGKHLSALEHLALVQHINELSTYQQIQFHELSAQAYRANDKALQSVAERIQLETLLDSDAGLAQNQHTLWLTLLHVPSSELTSMAAKAAPQSELQGWLHLALVSRQHANDSQALLAALKSWHAQFSTHPANKILPKPLESISPKLLLPPKHIALLLPLSGPFSGPGNAVRDGFIAAQKDSTHEVAQTRVYDTNKGDVTQLYRQAVNEGADYVVGPLLKGQVARVAVLDHPVPTLLLNDSVAGAQDNSYVFGLSPVNEATQVAIKAHHKGYNRALIIAPQNEWGEDVVSAFRTQWHKEGGVVVDSLAYGAKDDLNKKMRDFLHISDSQVRERQIKMVLGQNIEGAPSRRQDFDMIFLLAYPSKARQIMPLLHYYYAGDVPVYATSSVYTAQANALKDKDLDGLIFCDIPWVFAHQMGVKNWPEQFNSYNRLYALGIDSYALTTRLNQLLLFPAAGSDNGTLYLQPAQQVARVLEWGQFRHGLAHSLGETV